MDERDVAKKPMRNDKAIYGMGYDYHDWIYPSCKHLLFYEPCPNLTTLQKVQLEINKRVFDKLYSPTTTRGGQIKTRDIWEICKMVESNRMKDEASALVFDGMEHWDSGVNEYVIGLPTSEQREALKKATIEEYDLDEFTGNEKPGWSVYFYESNPPLAIRSTKGVDISTIDILSCEDYRTYQKPNRLWDAEFLGRMAVTNPIAEWGLYLLIGKWDQDISEYGGVC